MSIIQDSDTDTLQEIRYEIDVALTAAELPDAVLTSKTVLRAANRGTLKAVGMTAAEYDALEDDDERKEVFEEVVIKTCTAELLPRVAQIIMDNENGLLTRYQQINWLDRLKRINTKIADLLAPYASSTLSDYFQVVSRTKAETKPRGYRRRY